MSCCLFSPFHTCKLFCPSCSWQRKGKIHPVLNLPTGDWGERDKKKWEWICPYIQYGVLGMLQCWGYNVFYYCILVDQCWVDQLKSTLNSTGQPDWRQTLPLTEDINLWQFSPLSEAHAGIEFTSKRRGQLSDIQEVWGDAADELEFLMTLILEMIQTALKAIFHHKWLIVIIVLSEWGSK